MLDMIYTGLIVLIIINVVVLAVTYGLLWLVKKP